MKRLIRSANLGKDYFLPNDLNIEVGDYEFLISIVNKDKIVHQEENYSGTYIDLMTKEDIGAANFNIVEKNSEEFYELPNPESFEEYDIIIDIERVELRPEYRGAGVIWLGFDAWIDKVLMKYVNAYGLDKICIVSTFENYEFSKSLPDYIRSKVNVEFIVFY